MLTKQIHESRLSKQNVRTKPRLTTSPAVPLRTPAKEPTTAWQGMEKSPSFYTLYFRLATNHGPLLRERLNVHFLHMKLCP